MNIYLLKKRYVLYGLLIAFNASYMYAGAICDFKIQNLKEGIVAIESATKIKDKQKLLNAKDDLRKLEQHCDDNKILEEIEEHIKNTKEQLDLANKEMSEAISSKDKHRITQANISLNIAKTQYIAAKQERLRMRDLLRNNGK